MRHNNALVDSSQDFYAHTSAASLKEAPGLLVLDGLDDALAGGGAGWEEACEDSYKET